MAYGAQIEDEASSFINSLIAVGFEPKYIQLSEKNSFSRVDRSFSIMADICRLLDRLDIIVLGTSNPNVVPMIHLFQERGKEIIIFSSKIHRDLKINTDNWIEIDESLLIEDLQSKMKIEN